MLKDVLLKSCGVCGSAVCEYCPAGNTARSPFKCFTALIVIRGKRRVNYRQGSKDRPKTSHTMSLQFISTHKTLCLTAVSLIVTSVCMPISPRGCLDMKDLIKIAKYEIL